MQESQALWNRAKQVMPGGVNSPVRAFGSVGGNPIYIKKATGAWLVDVDGNRYLDLIGSWGPMVLGHGHPEILEVLRNQMDFGLGFGTCSEPEVELAELICNMLPFIEKVRLVNSGTEATMSALRLARGFTGRDLIVKFRGCYHGHGDSFLIEAGSGALTHGVPSSQGIPHSLAQLTLVADYNHIEQVEQFFAQYPKQIATVVVEPIAGNMGVVPPQLGFLQGLRKLCDKDGALLFFDEVMTGFRVGPQGAVGLYGVTPDLITLGKIIGGGLPVGAYGGRSEIMDKVSPMGKVYQAGTLSGNPLAVSAGLAQLRLLQRLQPWTSLDSIGSQVTEALLISAQRYHVNLQVNRVGSMLTAFFTPNPVNDTASALQADAKQYARFFHGLLQRGVMAAPSAYEALFVSLAHGTAEIRFLAEAIEDIFSHWHEERE